MELTVIYQCVAALDIHQAKLTVCIMFMNALGQVVSEIREFGGFKRDRRAMAEWVASFNPELMVMESTGIYWKSPYAALERHGLKIAVVNARHVKQVPGRKTRKTGFSSNITTLTFSFLDQQVIFSLNRNNSLKRRLFRFILAGYRSLCFIFKWLQKANI